MPWLIGGAADLAPSTKTLLKSERFVRGARIRRAATCISASASTRWAAICNGMALSKLRPFGAGFLIFSDYMRGSIRLAAIMELPVVWVFTHDSIGVGEDGPTHQPVEQLAGLRGIPGMHTIRPVRRERGGRGVARRLARATSSRRPWC